MNDPSSTAHVKMMETYHFSRDVEHLIKGLFGAAAVRYCVYF